MKLGSSPVIKTQQSQPARLHAAD